MSTHRELFDEAEAALTRAAADAAEAQTMSGVEGAAVLGQHARMLAALTRHLDYIHGQAAGGMAASQNPSGRDRATTGLLTALRRHTPRGEVGEPQTGTQRAAGAELAAAADAIELATDVLATHHRPGYGPYTPDARVVDDPHARWHVTVRAADLAYTAALTRARLAGRLAPGPRSRETPRILAGAELLQAARGVLSTAADTGPGSKALLELGPFAAPLPPTNPLAPAAKALAYARAETHQLTAGGRLGVGPLRDLALLELSIASHTDAVTRAAAARAGAHLPAGRAGVAADTLGQAADAARELARRWRGTYAELRPLRSVEPAQGGLAHAALAVRAALEPHTRRDGRWATPQEMHPTAGHMDQLLTGIRAIALPLDELAAAGRHALTDLQRRGQLYIHARALPDDPELLHAQHTGKYLPVPADVREQLADSWREGAEAGQGLTAALATSTGLVGSHPRPTAAAARMRDPEIAEGGVADPVQEPTPCADPASASTRDTFRGPASTSGTPVTTGEASNINAAREALHALAGTAEQAATAVDNLSASLASVDVDTETLADVTGLLEAADHLKTAARQALVGLNRRHAAMEEAVNATEKPAAPHFYRHRH